MERQEIIDKYSSFFKKNWIAVVPGIIGLILLGYGLIGLLTSSNDPNDISFTKRGEAETSQLENNNKREIMVDVEGAVLSPGVYNLSQNARIKDALIAAGGLSGSADRDWIAKNLNLAAKLSDAAKLYIPFKGEAGIQSYNSGGINLISSSININSASMKELDSLSGIGPVTAQKIIDGRPYQAVDELISKKIIGNSVFEKIKDRITAY
ncbi:MAG: helix-hairpin-helix domain-containing protein [Candidatus Levybacteria bacterium]|nr:helix-hairpin-helix domain-containing protein [Candidatus Levybacteria bacterium]